MRGVRMPVPRVMETQTALILGGLALLCFLPFWSSEVRVFDLGSDFRTSQLSRVLFFAIALLGLTILTGRAGLVSLGHGAFLGIGAYAAVIAMIEWDIPYGLAIPFGGAVGFVLGALFGLPALRLSAHTLVVVSISLAIALPTVLRYSEWTGWTGGSNGLVLKPIDVPFDLPITQDQWLYFLSLGVFLLMLAITWNLLRGRLGRAWMATRDHEIAAASMGINLAIYRTMAFAFAGLFAGVAGGLYGVVQEFVSPDDFLVTLSILLLTGAVVGGRDYILGVLPGAFFIQFIPVWSDDFAQQLNDVGILGDRDLPPAIVYGVVLIIVMFLLPDGVVGGLLRAWAWLKQRGR